MLIQCHVLISISNQSLSNTTYNVMHVMSCAIDAKK